MFDGLDEELAALGFTAFDIQLPGRDESVAPLDGSLRLDRLDDGFALRTVDYGNAHTLGMARTEVEARELVLSYVARPLPPVAAVSKEQLDELAGDVARHYFDLRDRATAAGPAGIVIDLPPKLPLDRIGALDGVLLFPIDTPFELRALPPTALRPENDVHQFVTAAQIRVGAKIVPPWFGQPGGGIRFELQAPSTGIRDLVVVGALQRIHVA
jgi:hypothetical protein